MDEKLIVGLLAGFITGWATGVYVYRKMLDQGARQKNVEPHDPLIVDDDGVISHGAEEELEHRDDEVLYPLDPKLETAPSGNEGLVPGPSAPVRHVPSAKAVRPARLGCNTCGGPFLTTGTACLYCRGPLHVPCFRSGNGHCADCLAR